MFKLTTDKNTRVYAAVIFGGLVLMAASALGGWQLGHSHGAQSEKTQRPTAVKGAQSQTFGSFRTYKSGEFYGAPDRQDPRIIMGILRQKAEQHRLALIAEAARERTRRLVAPDRSNINCGRMKCIALTYDDGPHKKLSPKLLDVLREREAVATFFVVGNKIDGNQSLLKRMVQEKNEAANHSWSHANLKLLTDEQIKHQTKRTNNQIKIATGQPPNLMRPPYAKRDARVVSQIGMPIGLWNIDPEDWRAPSARAIYKHVVSKAKPGAIVVMHDVKEKSVKAAPLIIDELQRQGYVLVTVSEMFGITSQNRADFAGRLLYHR